MACFTKIQTHNIAQTIILIRQVSHLTSMGQQFGERSMITIAMSANLGLQQAGLAFIPPYCRRASLSARLASSLSPHRRPHIARRSRHSPAPQPVASIVYITTVARIGFQLIRPLLLALRLISPRSGLFALWLISPLAYQPSGLSALWPISHLVCQPSGLLALWPDSPLACQLSGLLALWPISPPITYFCLSLLALC